MPPPKVSQEHFRPRPIQLPPFDRSVLAGHVHEHDTVRLVPVSHRDDFRLCRYLLETFHYLGLKRTPAGESLTYLAFIGLRPVACLVWASAAFKVACRDQFVGWSPKQRRKALYLLVNNTRFLILPWVRIKNLASTLLSLATKRLAHDWMARYGHRVVLAETFVEKDRFRGTCYRAANWSYVGDTQGRGKYDRYSTYSLPVKAVFLRPLAKNWRAQLCE